jgi:hypothetical protein
MQVSQQILKTDIRIVYDILHSLINVENLLRKHKLAEVLSPYATNCGDKFVERTYIKECDNIKQYIKGIRDEKEILLERLNNK